MCFQTFSPSERDRRSRAFGRDFGKTRPRLFWTGHDPLCQWTVDHRVDRSISQPIDGEAGVRQKSIEITRVSARSRHACRAPQSRHSHQPVRRDEDLARHKIGPPPPATGDTLRTPANTQTAAGIWQRSSRHRFLTLVHTIITLASLPTAGTADFRSPGTTQNQTAITTTTTSARQCSLSGAACSTHHRLQDPAPHRWRPCPLRSSLSWSTPSRCPRRRPPTRPSAQCK